LLDFPEGFETERLRVRSPLPGDGPQMHAAVNESLEELSPWMPWPGEHETVEDSEASVRRARARFLERSDLQMLLFLKGTNTLVGSSGLHRIDWSVPKFEIGYWCRTRFAGRGYVTEAVRGITAFAFDALGARRVEIRCDSRNLPSAGVAERAGFGLEGKLRNNEKSTDGDLRDTLVFSIIPEGSKEKHYTSRNTRRLGTTR
jgi:RimJ/RimL family protein N-acetyltransferase